MWRRPAPRRRDRARPVPGPTALAATEPARPARIATARWAPALVAATVGIDAFMGQLGASIVTLAPPAISPDLAVTTGQTAWAALSYPLTPVTQVAPIGRWADTGGPHTALYLRIRGVRVASLACVLAPNLIMLDPVPGLSGRRRGQQRRPDRRG